MLTNKIKSNTILPKINFIKAFIIFLFSFVLTKAQTNDLFSPQNRLNFGNYLFSDKDYLRAIGEFKSYLQATNNDTIKFKMAFSLSEMKRFQEAGDNFKGLFFTSSLSEEAKFEYLKTHFLSEEPKTFRDLINSSRFLPEKYSQNINQLKQISLLKEENVFPDSNEISNMFSENDKIELLKFYIRKINPEYKSPGTAALLSAIIPGLGKIYAGEIGDGITSFLFTGVLSFLAYDNFKADHDFRAWLFTGLAALFYGGNIYGSAAAAQNYNAGINFNFRNDLNIYLNSKNYFFPEYEFLKR